MNIIQLIASLSILVFIHELGHFFFARLFGTRVEKFYLFFNPWFSLLKWRSRRSGTVYGLGWLPLGGYCQIAGMVDESMDMEQMKQAPKSDEFRSKTTWQRLLIMAGGIIFNLILAFLIYTTVAYVWGDKYLKTTEVREGWTFSPAAQGVGFMDGDVIYSIDGDTVLNALDNRMLERMINAKEVVVIRQGAKVDLSIPVDMMQRVLSEQKGFARMNIPFVIGAVQNPKLLEAGVQRGDKLITVNGETASTLDLAFELLSRHSGKLVQLSFERGDSTLLVDAVVNTEGKIGVELASPLEIFPVEQVSYSALGAIPAGFEKAVATADSYISGMKHIFTKEGVKSLGGLGTMSKLFPKSFDWQMFWITTAFLSIILAVMNLIPIPALDGGHIAFLLIEMITGRKPSDKVMGYIQTAGMIFLILLMLYANGNDIVRYLLN